MSDKKSEKEVKMADENNSEELRDRALFALKQAGIFVDKVDNFITIIDEKDTKQEVLILTIKVTY